MEKEQEDSLHHCEAPGSFLGGGEAKRREIDPSGLRRRSELRRQQRCARVGWCREEVWAQTGLRVLL
jgi:hypothetical protein